MIQKVKTIQAEIIYKIAYTFIHYAFSGILDAFFSSVNISVPIFWFVFFISQNLQYYEFMAFLNHAFGY